MKPFNRYLLTASPLLFLATAIVASILPIGEVSAAQSVTFLQNGSGVIFPWPVDGSNVPTVDCVTGCSAGGGGGITLPNPVTSTNGSTTITTGNTFQTLLALNASRKGCSIQNPSDATEVLYVSVGIATGSATKAKSYQLTAGSTFSCSAGGNVITDNIAVTAVTSAHAFVETDQ